MPQEVYLWDGPGPGVEGITQGTTGYVHGCTDPPAAGKDKVELAPDELDSYDWLRGRGEALIDWT